MNYRYAELRDTGARWYLEFYAWNPAINALGRKRVYINRIRSETLRRRTAQKMADHINSRLDTGWNPFISEDTHRQFITLSAALDFMLQLKSKYLRPRSLPNYRERIRTLNEYLEKKYGRKLLSGEVSEKIAQDFMQDQLLNTGINARTYNSKLTDYRGFFNFLVLHKYCSHNPFKTIHNLKEQGKKKMPFPYALQKQYATWCLENDYPLYMASMLCYYCGLRPVEIVGIKRADVRENQLISVYPDNAKGGRQRSAPVPDVFFTQLQEFIREIPPDFYLFSTGLLPGAKKIAPTRLAGRFSMARAALNIAPEITFYSLKDTSAENLDYAGFSTKALQLLYGHTNIKTTDAYMQNIGAKAFKDLITNFPAFGV